MRRETVQALDRINREFYLAQGDEFDATRQRPWSGWRRVVERFRSSRPAGHGAHSILDVGCGNGRFADFLATELDEGWEYTGIDASPVLLSSARSSAPSRQHSQQDNRQPGWRVVLADVATGDLPLARRDGVFDLIAVFGLMHHVPSWERRRSLLVELAEHLSPGGMLAVSFWQFGVDSRFDRRTLEWREYNATTSNPVSLEDLETGDRLLRWSDGAGVRYCHFAGPAEASELTAASGLARLETFRADGASGELNLYHLLIA
jgi:SAM-dependent methyltransferase